MSEKEIENWITSALKHTLKSNTESNPLFMFCKYLGWCWSWCHFSSCRWQCQWQRTCGSKAAWHTAGTGECCCSPHGCDPSNTANENKQKRYSFQLEVDWVFFSIDRIRDQHLWFLFLNFTSSELKHDNWIGSGHLTWPLALTTYFWSRTYHFVIRATLRLQLHLTNIFWLHCCFILTQGYCKVQNRKKWTKLLKKSLFRFPKSTECSKHGPT